MGDASPSCWEIIAIVLFSTVLCNVHPCGHIWASYLVSCDSSLLRNSVLGISISMQLIN